MTDIAALIARLRALYRSRWDSTPLSLLYKHAEEAADCIERLQRELEAERKDGARYRQICNSLLCPTSIDAAMEQSK